MVHCWITVESNYTPREDINILLSGVNLKIAKVKLFATLCKLTIMLRLFWVKKAAVYNYTVMLDDAVAWWQTATRLFLIIISQ